jgi:hypothetical protein
MFPGAGAGPPQDKAPGDGYLKPSNLSISFLAAALLAAATPATAVIRQAALESPADTLDLIPRDARDFRIRRLAGSDLHHAGLYLGLASIPAVLLLPWGADVLGVDRPVRGPREAFFILTYGVLPAFTAVMAAGNTVYAGAARYHPEREFAVTRSFLPLAAFALAAGKGFYLATHPDLAGTRGVGQGVLIAFALTEALTLPGLRSRFLTASSFLDQVHIRVTGQGAATAIAFDF